MAECSVVLSTLRALTLFVTGLVAGLAWLTAAVAFEFRCLNVNAVIFSG